MIALSNLLSANIDSALEYFVTMGYHDDLETRAAFLKVLSNILNQGAEFDSLAGESERYDKLVEVRCVVFCVVTPLYAICPY